MEFLKKTHNIYSRSIFKKPSNFGKLGWVTKRFIPPNRLELKKIVPKAQRSNADISKKGFKNVFLGNEHIGLDPGRYKVCLSICSNFKIREAI